MVGERHRSRLVVAFSALLLSLPSLAVDEADGSTTTIGAEEIAKERPSDVMALLKSRVGLDDAGGTVSIRGVPGVVVQIDGFTASVLEMKQLKPEQIEKVVIVRGGASAEFGAEAMGGAVLITTWKQRSESHADLAQSFTSLEGYSTSIRGSRKAGRYDLGVVIDESHLGGSKRVKESPYPYQITVEDEYSVKQLFDGKVGLQAAGATHRMNVKHQRLDSHYGRPNWWEEYAVTTLRATSSYRYAKHDVTLSAGYENYDDRGLRDVGTGTDGAGLAPDRYLLSEGQKWDAAYRMEQRSEGGTFRFELNGGVSEDGYRIEDYDTAALDFRLDSEVRNLAASLFYEEQFASSILLQLVGRYDHYWYPDTRIFNSESDIRESVGAGTEKDSFNPKLGMRWDLGGGKSVSSAIGTGFVPPTPYHLYYSDVSSSSEFVANPDLRPERSLTWDLGAKRTWEEGEVGITLYLTAWQNKIGVAIIDYGTPLRRQFQNTGAASSRGIEVQARARVNPRWSVFGNYTYNRAQITENSASPELVGNDLPDMPRHKANAGITYEGRQRIVGRLALRYVGETFTDERNTVVDAQGFQWRKDDYTLLDGSIVKRFDSGELTLAIDNLLDERYVTGFFREGLGRLVRLEMAIRL